MRPLVGGAYRRGVRILGWTPDGRRRRLTREMGGAARLLAAVVVGCVVAAGGGAAQAADVHGDDETDAYVGTGGLILPAGVDAATRTIVASCCRLLTGACPPRAYGQTWDIRSTGSRRA